MEILQAELISELKNTISTTSSYTQHGEIENVVKFFIDPNEKNSTGSPVISRCYEYTRLFQEYKIHMSKECSCCKSSSMVLLQIHVPRDIIIYRNKTYYEDGSVNVVETGDYRF